MKRYGDEVEFWITLWFKRSNDINVYKTYKDVNCSWDAVRIVCLLQWVWLQMNNSLPQHARTSTQSRIVFLHVIQQVFFIFFYLHWKLCLIHLYCIVYSLMFPKLVLGDCVAGSREGRKRGLSADPRGHQLGKRWTREPFECLRV